MPIKIEVIINTRIASFGLDVTLPPVSIVGLKVFILGTALIITINDNKDIITANPFGNAADPKGSYSGSGNSRRNNKLQY